MNPSIIYSREFTPPDIYQVILNKDVSYQPDPILLEEPSHVMLNHIYAQVLGK